MTQNPIYGLSPVKFLLDEKSQLLCHYRMFFNYRMTSRLSEGEDAEIDMGISSRFEELNCAHDKP